MENKPFFSFKSNPIYKILVCSCLALTINSAQAQTIQTFKVAPPAEAQALVKDDVDNFLSFSPVFFFRILGPTRCPHFRKTSGISPVV